MMRLHHHQLDLQINRLINAAGLAGSLPSSTGSGPASISDHDMTDATTRKCSHCGERLSLVQRSGRDSYRARANRERSFHEEKRYCSATCRKLASKARRTPFKTAVSGPPARDKASQGSKPFSGVTTATNLVDLPAVSGARKSGEASLKMDFGGFTVVPDKEWRGMYRVRKPDGRLTDMINLTRARDAARCFAEQEHRQEPQPLAMAA